MALVVDPVVELYVASQWTEITGDVRQNQGIEITYGRRSGSSSMPGPATCRMVLDNASGNYSSRNPLGTYYGTLGRNTPIRVSRRLASDTYTRTVSGGWGTSPAAPVAYAWTTVDGSGGVVQASDWAVTGTQATHSIPTTAAYRISTLLDINQVDVDLAVTFTLPAADITGGAVEPANFVFRRTAATTYFMLRLTVKTDETVTFKVIRVVAGVETTMAEGSTDEWTSAVVHSGQAIRVRFQAENWTCRAKAWNASSAEPLDWEMYAPMDYNAAAIPVAGAVGIRTGVASGNTNASPFVVSYDNFELRSPRFAGEVSEWPPRWDVSGNDATVPIEAAGILRRLGQGASPSESALRRSIVERPGLVAYIPCEDGRDATEFASALPGHPAAAILQGEPQMAAYSDLVASDPLPYAHNGSWSALVPTYTATGVAQVRFITFMPAAGSTDDTILLRWYTDHATAKFWQFVYRSAGSGAVELQAWKSESDPEYNSGSIAQTVEGIQVRWSIRLTNNGADVDWLVSSYDINGDGSVSNSIGTATGFNIANVSRIWVNPGGAHDQVAFGHITVQNQTTISVDLFSETAAYDGETAVTRIERLAEENSVAFDTEFYGPIPSTPMGPQRNNTLLNLVQECVDADMGVAYEPRGGNGAIAYRSRSSLYNQAAKLTLSYAGRQLATPFEPTEDDQYSRNRVKASRVNGASATYEQTTGRLQVSDPGTGGIGVYDDQVTVNVELDVQLLDIAGWCVSLGTVDEPRYPTLTVNLANSAVLAAPSIGQAILDLRPGDVVSITNATEIFQHDTIKQIVDGYRETLTRFLHIFELDCSPASPYSVFTVEDATYGRLDSATATLENAITTTSQTTFTVKVATGDPLWTEDAADIPFDILVGGERMTVTGITTTTPSFVSAGTAAHADNASVTPGLPAGAATGDLLLVFAAANKADFTALPTVPAEYSTLLDLGAFKLFGKTHDGTESAPTVGLSGGAAGVPLSAQMCALRDVPMILRASSQQFNTGQNITFPSLDSTISKSIALALGWKADDWTSVDTLSGWTEIGEPSTTLGNDNGLVWDYKAFTQTVAVPIDSFVVTGGASASNRGAVVAFGNHQTFTVTRAVNGVAKTHSAGAEVHIFDAVHIAL